MKTLEPNLKIKVLGVGRSWPGASPVTNADLLALQPDYQGRSRESLEALGQRLERRFGFRQRYLSRLPRWGSAGPAEDEETSETLALRAATEALAGRPGEQVQAFVHGTTTTSRYTGSQAAAIQGKLGGHAAAYEIKAGCSTSLASLHLAFSLLGAGYDNVLVSCAETLSKVMNPEQGETLFVLADGAGAVWLQRGAPDPDFEVRQCFYATDGQLVDLYTTPGRLPPHRAALESGGYFLAGDGTRLREEALRRYLFMLERLFPGGRGLERVRWLIPHQVNRGLVEEVLQKSGLRARVVWSADRFGNLGGASVVFSLAEAWEQRLFAPGDEILLMSVGGGLSFAMQRWVRL